MSFWQLHEFEIVSILFLVGIALFPWLTRAIAFVGLFLLNIPFDLTSSFSIGSKIALLTFPYFAVSINACLKFPRLCYLLVVLAFCGTGSEINQVDRWLRRKQFVSPERRLLTDYLDQFAERILALGAFTLGMILLLLVIAGLLFLLFVGISRIPAIIGGIVAVLVAGTLLYMFRINSRLLYGVFEIVFAAVLALFTVYHSFESSRVTIAAFFTAPNLAARMFALSTSVYIVVRGWDNIGEERFKTLLNKLEKRLRRRSNPEIQKLTEATEPDQTVRQEPNL